jgi:thiamine biosynthesis lipoprotein
MASSRPPWFAQAWAQRLKHKLGRTPEASSEPPGSESKEPSTDAPPAARNDESAAASAAARFAPTEPARAQAPGTEASSSGITRATSSTPPSTEPVRRRAEAAHRPINTRGGWVRRDEAIMGTAISVQLWAEEPRHGVAACAAVMEEMHRVDRRMSPHKKSSELSRINREAGERAVPVGDEMFRLLERAMAFSRLTQGAFDITYAAVGHLYDYRAGIRPSDEAIAAARTAVGWKQLLLDPKARTVRFGKPGMLIDLGGFAKGHAVDNAVAMLQRLGIKDAYVAAGGDSRVLGSRRGRPWTVAIRDPRREDEVVAVLPLEETAISTSGDYERYFEERAGDGTLTRHHHLIDPSTGRSPATGIRSVTILAPDGLTSEALSKAVFVLGAERGFELLETFPGVDAVIIDHVGRLKATPGLLNAGGLPAPHGEPS